MFCLWNKLILMNIPKIAPKSVPNMHWIPYRMKNNLKSHCDVTDHKFYYCICYYYHFVFVIINRLFWQKKFWFCVSKKMQMIFFQKLNIKWFSDPSKKGILLKLNKSMFYQQAFDFSGFRQVSAFSEKETFKLFVVEICVKRCKGLK